MVAGRIGEHVADGAGGSRIHVGDLIQSPRHTSEIRASDRRRISGVTDSRAFTEAEASEADGSEAGAFEV